MAMPSGRAATACHALLRALHARALKLRNHCHYFASSGGGPSPSSSCRLPVFAALLCGATAASLFPRAAAFFLPLAASTAAFLATAYLSAAADPDRGAAKEVVLVRGAGEPAEAGTLQVYADADASAYGGGDGGIRGGGGVRQVGCFLRRSAKRGFDEDGEEVVFAGRLLMPAAPAGAGALEEELVSLHVDRMAEGVWNSYLGRWSTWNHYALDGCDD